MAARPARMSLKRGAHPRVDRRLDQVDDEVQRDEEHRQHECRALQDGDVTLEDRVV